MLVKVREHGLACLLGIGSFESMAGTLQRQKFGIDIHRLQSFDQPGCLLVSDILVFCSVNDERRSGIRRYPVERAGDDVLVTGRFQVSAEKQGENLCGVDAFTVGLRKVGRPVDIDNAVYPARLITVVIAIGVILFVDWSGETEEQREMPPRRIASRANTLGVDAIFGRMGTKPGTAALTSCTAAGNLYLGERR